MEMMIDSEKRNLNWAPNWIPAATVLGVSLLVLGIVFWSSYSDIVAIWWRSDTYAHGFLILPIVAYLVWEKRTDLAGVSPQPASRVVPLMVFPAIFWLLGYVANVAVLEQFAVVAMLPLMAWIVLGNDATKKIMFPLLYLFFAVPAGDFLIAPLQNVTAAFAVWGLQMTGIPVYWEGLFFHIPSGSFEVAVACSGISYLIASMALGTLYAYLTYTSMNRRIIFIALSAVIPVIANGIRVYGIVMIAHLSDYTLAVSVDHILYGWLFFGVIILLLFWAGSFFREEPVPVTGKGDDGTVSTSSFSGVSVLGVKSFALWSIMGIILVASAPGFAAWMDAQSAAMPDADVQLPLGQGGWTGPVDTNTRWRPSFAGAKEHRAEYRKNSVSVQVYLAYYPVSNREAEVINWSNVVFDEKNSRRLGGGTTQVRLSAGQNWPVLTTRLESEGRSRLLWYWYEVDGSATVSRVRAKAYAARSRLLDSRIGSAAWVISTEYSMEAEEASVVMEDFLTAMLPQLREAVAQ